MRFVLGLLVALLLPGALFCAVAGARRGLCLDAYAWEQDAGWVPTAQDCTGAPRATVGRAAGFYATAVGGLFVGRAGRSREDASQSLATLLAARGRRSAAVLVVAVGALGLGSVVRRGAASVLPRLDRWAPLRRARALVAGVGPLTAPAGLPLPLAGLLVFALVVRVVPAGSRLDYDRAGILWAGLALALADGVSAVLARGLDHARRSERARPYAEALALWGRDPEPAIADVSRGVRAAQMRGALLGLLGGLLVVEGVFYVNGLGETLRDIVADRGGVDPLLLCGVLLCFSLFVLAVEWAPIERLLGGRP